jgi:hypothetical protein
LFLERSAGREEGRGVGRGGGYLANQVLDQVDSLERDALVASGHVGMQALEFPSNLRGGRARGGVIDSGREGGREGGRV